MLNFPEFSHIRTERNFSLARHTTYGLGGNAPVAYFPKNSVEFCALYDELKQRNLPFFVLGRGSNLLVSDRGYDGAVVATSSFRTIKREGNEIICSSGATVGDLLNFCKAEGLGGLEYLAGIPATLGGVAYMNGGAGGKFIAENIKSVTIYDGKLRELSLKDCNFGNKHSIMRDINCIILGIRLKTFADSPIIIAERIADRLQARATQPGGKSCGCVFKNPMGESAGKLIDECGLKGARIGGAQVSDRHANFILNRGGTAADVRALIALIQREVYQKRGVRLEEEVIYIGDFNDSNG